MKKMWKNRSGVSPVIATLLLIGITVVLSSVVYVMVMGLGENHDRPAADLSASSISGVDDKVTIVMVSRPIAYDELKVAIVVGADSEVQTVAQNFTDVIWPEGVSSVTFVDRANDGTVDTGDHFLIDAVEGTDIALALIYVADGSGIAQVSWTSL